MPSFRKAHELSEANGIQAIIDLQKLAGHEETEEEARLGWGSMNDAERIQTMYFHDLLCSKSA